MKLDKPFHDQESPKEKRERKSKKRKERKDIADRFSLSKEEKKSKRSEAQVLRQLEEDLAHVDTTDTRDEALESHLDDIAARSKKDTRTPEERREERQAKRAEKKARRKAERLAKKEEREAKREYREELASRLKKPSDGRGMVAEFVEEPIHKGEAFASREETPASPQGQATATPEVEYLKPLEKVTLASSPGDIYIGDEGYTALTDEMVYPDAERQYYNPEEADLLRAISELEEDEAAEAADKAEIAELVEDMQEKSDDETGDDDDVADADPPAPYNFNNPSEEDFK